MRFLSHSKHLSRLIIWAVMLFSSPAIQADGDQQKKFDEVKKAIEQLKLELEKTKSNRDNLQKSLQENEESIRELNNKSQQLLKDIDQKQSNLEQLKNQKHQYQKKKSEQVELVESYINAAYRLGQHSQIRLLLSQQDPSEISRMQKYYAAFSESRSQKIEEFVDTIKKLETVETDIARETESLKRTYAELKKKRQSLKRSQQDRQQILVKLDTDLSNQQQRLNALIADRRRLEKLLSKVYEEINAQELSVGIENFSQYKGRLSWPAHGKRLNSYGAPRRGSNLKWQGIQISAPRGTKVIAIHHGQVVFSDYLRGHGLLLIIDHGAGYMSLYAHNENLMKELGAWVEAGETVATVGDTGGRRDTALYFELRRNGQPTNPSPWFKKS